MKSKRIPRLVVALLLVVTAGLCILYGSVRWYHAPARDLRQVLGWLPADTETVYCIGGPFLLEKGKPARINSSSSLSEWLEILSTNLVYELQDGWLDARLQGRRVALCVEGSRRFRSPRSLGLGPYQGATILVFDGPLGWSGFLLQSALASRAKQVKLIAGTPVACFEEEWEADTWEISIAIPRADILIAATDQRYLEEVLRRLEVGSPPERLPAHFEDGLRRSDGARYWASRRYDPANALEDPTSPLRAKHAANEPDPQARGLHFVYDPGRSPFARVTYLSTNPEAVEIAGRFWRHPHEDLLPEITLAAPGEVEVGFRDDSAGRSMFHLVLLAALGHAIFL